VYSPPSAVARRVWVQRAAEAGEGRGKDAEGNVEGERGNQGGDGNAAQRRDRIRSSGGYCFYNS
jgi:hypothetical protein